jgi:hypothetical protein
VSSVAGLEIFLCSNYVLDVVAVAAADGLSATILGVGEPSEICLTAEGPARWVELLPATVPKGYRVRLVLAGDTDTFRLDRVGEGVEVAEEEASFAIVGPL